jgi:acetyl-CoA carboxylase carboxyl transferase subunit alpha
VREKQTPEAAWERVQRARHPNRPRTLGYISGLCTEFIPLHGDRLYGDDPALVGGVGRFNGRSVMLIGNQSGGSDAKENLKRNFGMSKPEGYHKAKRLMLHAEKFGFPVVSFIDTMAADPTLPSEERGQALAIADAIATMLGLRVPTVSVVIGQGGSGGALAIGVTDRILMMENAVYAVAPPEAAALILKLDPAAKQEIAAAMRITGPDSPIFGVIDEVIPEPTPAHEDPLDAIDAVGIAIDRQLASLDATYGIGARLDAARLLADRYAKYRSVGQWLEHPLEVAPTPDPSPAMRERGA